MGDITLHLLLDCTLLKNKAITAGIDNNDDFYYKDVDSSSSSTSSFQFQNISQVLPADASLAELLQAILTTLRGDAAKSSTTPTKSTASHNVKNNCTVDDKNSSELCILFDNLTIIDASYHPAKVVTPTFRQFSQSSGPNSKTLMSMGWYPSGKLVILSLSRTKPASLSSATKESSASSIHSQPTDAEEEILLNRFIEWHHRFVLQHEEGSYNDPTAASEKNRASGGGGGSSHANSAGVIWTGIGGAVSSTSSSTSQPVVLKPSEIFHAVEQRSISNDMQMTTNIIQKKKKMKKSRSRRTEMERSERLNSLLQKLDTTGGLGADNAELKKKKKNRGVSQKVRSMLLKSHSVGNKKLRMEDRFHLEVIYLSDIVRKEEHCTKSSHCDDTNVDETTKKNMRANGTVTSSYRFFSRQTTAGKVASTVVPDVGKDMAVELLVSYPPPPVSTPPTPKEQERNGVRYRRLPNTMTLHDAQCAGWMQEFDVVMVRVFNILIDRNKDGVGTLEDKKFGLSKSVLDSDSDGEDDDDEIEIDDEDGVAASDAHEQGCSSELLHCTKEVNRESNDSHTNDHSQEVPRQELPRDDALQQRLHLLFQSTNLRNPKSNAKKPISKQVRTMLMKSKSVGNVRIKQEDRIYLEVIYFRDSDNIDVAGATVNVSCADLNASSSYRFFSKQTDLRQIIDTARSDEKINNICCTAETVELFVPSCCHHNQSPDNKHEVVSYLSLDESMTLGDAVHSGYIDNFGSIILRAYSK